MAVFLDTNVFVYHLMNNHDNHSPRCSALFQRIDAGEVAAVTAVTAVGETLWILTHVFERDRRSAASAMTMMLLGPEIGIDYRGAVLGAMAFWAEHSPLSFPDCYHLALTKEMGMTEIYTFDQKMDRFPGVERVEP